MHLAGVLAGLYVLLMTPFGAQLFADRPRPSPHLFVTIALWLVSVASVEIRPVAEPSD
jgi:hypothetical protein